MVPRWATLAGITLLAVSLRYWGICWSAPDRVDLNPDEMDYVIKHAIVLMDKVAAVQNGTVPFTRDTLDPVFLNYPSFLMYMTAGVTGLCHEMGLLTRGLWQTYLVGRYISATFGAATCIVIFLMAEELGASILGAGLAALSMAIMPLNVWDSHFATTDVLMTFWVAMTLFASLRLIRTGRWFDYVFAGISLGLAVGSKYTAALAVVAVVIAAFVSRRPFVHTMKGLMLAGVASLLFCFLVTPYSFLRLHDVLAAMQFEHNHTTGHHLGFSLPAKGQQYHKYLYQLVAAWPFSLGFALYACALAGTFWALFRLDRRRVVLLGFIAVFFGITGHWTFTPIRYYMPILVTTMVFTGVWLGDWLASAIVWRRCVAITSAIIMLLYTGIFTWQTTARFSNETRMEAGHWLDQHFPNGGTVMNCGWHRYMAMPSATNILVSGREREDSVLVVQHAGPDDLIQITSLLYDRQYRHGDPTYTPRYDRLRDPNGEYQLVKRFESQFLNKNLYAALDPMFGGYFVSPTIEFYERKK